MCRAGKISHHERITPRRYFAFSAAIAFLQPGGVPGTTDAGADDANQCKNKKRKDKAEYESFLGIHKIHHVAYLLGIVVVGFKSGCGSLAYLDYGSFALGLGHVNDRCNDHNRQKKESKRAAGGPQTRAGAPIEFDLRPPVVEKHRESARGQEAWANEKTRNDRQKNYRQKQGEESSHGGAGKAVRPVQFG